ncbi:MAG: phosphorylase [Methylomonas sp.]
MRSEPQPSSLWIVGIVVALPEELATITNLKTAPGGIVEINRNILVAYAGAGPANAERAANLLCNKGVNALISWGCAAALSGHLKPGDLLIPEQVCSAQQQFFNCDKLWLRHLQNLLAAKLAFTTGSLAESSDIVANSLDKQRIHLQTGAHALDMESATVFKIALRAGLPCLAIRAIVDPVTMDLPQAVVQSLNSEGRVELLKLLQFLLFHPYEITALLKLGVYFHAAGRTLKIVAEQLNDIINFKNNSEEEHLGAEI